MTPNETAGGVVLVLVGAYAALALALVVADWIDARRWRRQLELVADAARLAREDRRRVIGCDGEARQ